MRSVVSSSLDSTRGSRAPWYARRMRLAHAPKLDAATGGCPLRSQGGGRTLPLLLSVALAGCGGEPAEPRVPPQQAPAPSATAPAEPPPPPKPAKLGPIAAHRLLGQPRPAQILHAELEALERLFQATPKAAPDRPVLLSRLGETRLELFFATSAPQEGAEAKRLFGRVVTEYPRHERIARSHYGLGLLHEQDQEPDAAARAYELAASAPGSRLVGLARLGLGVVRAALGQRAEAAEALRAALRELPEGTPAWRDAKERLRAVE